MLGLQHSASAMSVMYFLDLEGSECLDPTDLAALAKHISCVSRRWTSRSQSASLVHPKHHGSDPWPLTRIYKKESQCKPTDWLGYFNLRASAPPSANEGCDSQRATHICFNLAVSSSINADGGKGALIPLRQVLELPDDRFKKFAAYLLLWKKVPTAGGVNQLPELFNYLTAG